MIRFVAEMRLATGFQLARRWWSASAPTDPRARTARRTLARLESLRVIERLGRRMGGVRGGSTSIVFGLGPAGQRLLGSDGARRRLGAPGARYVAHTLDVTELAMRLHVATVEGEVELRELEAEPVCWRPHPGPLGARLTLKPDLFVSLGVGAAEDRWFIEVDRATESLATIRGKAERYLAHVREGSEQDRHGVYPRVLWTVPDAARQAQLIQVIRSLPDPASRLFTVWTFDEVIGRFAVEVRA